jgi:hypothetical protein
VASASVKAPDGTMTRSEFLSAQIGQPWAWRELNCWDFAAHVERELFGRILPIVTVPGDLSKRWVLEAIEGHPVAGGRDKPGRHCKRW